MDPVAHTLVGAVLAETGLKRVSRYATATLLIGVNLSDIDGIAKYWGSDASLVFQAWLMLISTLSASVLAMKQ